MPVAKKIVEIDDEDFGSAGKIAEKFEATAKDIPEERPAPRDIPKSVNDVFSPLERNDPNDGLRERKNWHQTWKRSDEFEAALDMGYKQIRKQKKGEKAAPGAEGGEVLTKTDEDGTIIAMEIPQWVYEDHINAKAAQSHRLYNDPELVMQNFANGTGHDLSSKKEQVSVSVTEYEAQREVLHRR
jgi:hypothetical protein